MKPNKSTMIVGNLEFCSLIEQITKGMLETESAHTHASYFFANSNFSRHFFFIRMDCNRICNFESQQGDGASLTEAF